MRELVNSGADVEAGTSLGVTALHMAAQVSARSGSIALTDLAAPRQPASGNLGLGTCAMFAAHVEATGGSS